MSKKKTIFFIMGFVFFVLICGLQQWRIERMKLALEEATHQPSPAQITWDPATVTKKIKPPPGAKSYKDSLEINFGGSKFDGPPGGYMCVEAMDISDMKFPAGCERPESRVAYIGHYLTRQFVELIPGSRVYDRINRPRRSMFGMSYSMYLIYYPGGHMAVCTGYLFDKEGCRTNNVFVTIISHNSKDHRFGF